MILDSLLSCGRPRDGTVRTAGDEGSFDRVLLAVDSEPDPAVIGTALSVAAAFDAEVHALSVVPMNAGVDHWDIVVERREAAAEDALDRADEAAAVPVTKRLRYGEPAEEIGLYADHNDVDLVVAGEPDRTGLARFLTPKSVTESLRRSVSLPVLAVPAAGEPANGRSRPLQSSNGAVPGDD